MNDVVHVCMEQIFCEDGSHWYEVYCVDSSGSIVSDCDEILSDLQSAEKVLRRFVNEFLK